MSVSVQRVAFRSSLDWVQARWALRGRFPTPAVDSAAAESAAKLELPPAVAFAKEALNQHLGSLLSVVGFGAFINLLTMPNDPLAEMNRVKLEAQHQAMLEEQELEGTRGGGAFILKKK